MTAIVQLERRPLAGSRKLLLHAVETSLKRGTFGERVRSSALALTPMLKLSALGAGVEAKVEP